MYLLKVWMSKDSLRKNNVIAEGSPSRFFGSFQSKSPENSDMEQAAFYHCSTETCTWKQTRVNHTHMLIFFTVKSNSCKIDLCLAMCSAVDEKFNHTSRMK
jgi:hypothetical protein